MLNEEADTSIKLFLAVNSEISLSSNICITLILGGYSFKLISFNAAIASVIWLVIPSTLYMVCYWIFNVYVLEPVETNGNYSSKSNSTSNTVNFYSIASYTGLSLELISVACTPLILGSIFSSSTEFLTNESFTPISKFVMVLCLAKLFLLGGYSLLIFFACYIDAQQYGLLYVILLYGIPKSYHCMNYVFLTFSAYFLSGSIISVLMNKCMKANKIVLIGEVKSCLKYYNCVRSKLGPLLLIFMSIDSLLVMLNTFMSYLACSPKYYVYMITFILWTLNGMLSLIYICVLCDACFNTLKGLLIPIRYT